MIAVIVLALVFLLIALRQILRLNIRIWQIMTIGVIIVLVEDNEINNCRKTTG